LQLTEQEGLVVQDFDGIRQDPIGSIEPFEGFLFPSERLKASSDVVAGIGVIRIQDVSPPVVVKCRVEPL
jgi:hypothetical protein